MASSMCTAWCLLRICSIFALLSRLPMAYAGGVQKVDTVCTVSPSTDGSDDAPAILSAFEQCGQDGSIVFTNDTFHIESVMNTTGLNNVTVDLQGTLLWGTNITYWRNNSLPLGYLNMSLAWAFGGSNIHFTGNGIGTFDGNGQIWYDFTKGVSNLPGRPINFVVFNTTNSIFEGLNFRQSQFWTMAIFGSTDLLFEDISINSTTNSSESARNTDGVDTFFSDNITFRRWDVTGGDDAISPKANSSNILIQDATFHGTLGVAIGSIGQMDGQFEFIENVTAERVTCIGSQNAAYIKTWTGIQQGFPPNGGGGGLGFARNLTFRDFTVTNLTTSLASITQCTSFEGATSGCDTSLFQLSNITWTNMTGTLATDNVAVLQCSGDAPCPGIEISDIGVEVPGGRGEEVVSCSNVVGLIGVECTEGD